MKGVCFMIALQLLLVHARVANAFVSTVLSTCQRQAPRCAPLGLKVFDIFQGLWFPDDALKEEPVDPRLTFVNLTFPDDNVQAARQSLVFFLHQWAQQLAQNNDKQQLATPITTSDFTPVPMLNDTLRMTLMFRPPPRYLSYNEQKSMEKGVLPDRKGGKLDSKSPGGITIVVTTEKMHDNGSCAVRLVAQRYGVDGDTIIKASSERAIIRRLNEALNIWQTVRAMKIPSSRST